MPQPDKTKSPSLSSLSISASSISKSSLDDDDEHDEDVDDDVLRWRLPDELLLAVVWLTTLLMDCGATTVLRGKDDDGDTTMAVVSIAKRRVMDNTVGVGTTLAVVDVFSGPQTVRSLPSSASEVETTAPPGVIPTQGRAYKSGSCSGLERARTPVPLTLTRVMRLMSHGIPRKNNSW